MAFDAPDRLEPQAAPPDLLGALLQRVDEVGEAAVEHVNHFLNFLTGVKPNIADKQPAAPRIEAPKALPAAVKEQASGAAARFSVMHLDEAEHLGNLSPLLPQEAARLPDRGVGGMSF